MIRPVLQDDALLRDIAAADGGEGFHLWWLGQSGFLLKWRGRYALLDPYLSDSLTNKYAGTDRPHVRMTLRAVAPEALGFVDVVTSSHNHTDHLDAETLCPILARSPGVRLVIPEANRDFVAQRLGIDPALPIGVDVGTEVEVAGFRIVGVPAAHEDLERQYLGYLLRFGPWSVYHSGDTLLYDGMAERLRPFRPDVALLPINGRARERRVAGNLDGREAARLAKEIGAGVVVPCHFEMFEFNTASPDEFVEEAARLSQPYRLLRCGERFTYGNR